MQNSRILIKRALQSQSAQDSVTLKGWVRTRRDNKDFSFLELNDGSCLANIQCVADAGIPGYEDIAKMSTGAASLIYDHAQISMVQFSVCAHVWLKLFTDSLMRETSPTSIPLLSPHQIGERFL